MQEESIGATALGRQNHERRGCPGLASGKSLTQVAALDGEAPCAQLLFDARAKLRVALKQFAGDLIL